MHGEDEVRGAEYMRSASPTRICIPTSPSPRVMDSRAPYEPVAVELPARISKKIVNKQNSNRRGSLFGLMFSSPVKPKDGRERPQMNSPPAFSPKLPSVGKLSRGSSTHRSTFRLRREDTETVRRSVNPSTASSPSMSRLQPQPPSRPGPSKRSQELRPGGSQKQLMSVGFLGSESVARNGSRRSLLKSKPKSKMEYEQECTMRVLNMIDQTSIEQLKLAFHSCSSKGKITRNNFIRIIALVLEGSQPERSLVNLAFYANQMFDLIDVNGLSTITWDDFTDFIVQSVYDLGKLNETKLEEYHHIKSFDCEDKVDKLYFFETFADSGILLLLKQSEAAFKVWFRDFDEEKGKEVSVEHGQPLSLDVLKGMSTYVLALSTIDSSILLYDVAPSAGTVQLKLTVLAKEIQTCLRFSKPTSLSSAALFSGSMSGKITKWDYQTGRMLFVTKTGHSDSVCTMIELHLSDSLATGALDGRILVWSLNTGRQQREYKAHKQGVLCLAYSSSNSLLCSSGFDHDIMLWNPTVGDQLICRLQGHSSALVAVAVAEHSPEVISISTDGSIKVWDVRSLTESQTIKLEIGRNQVTDFVFLEKQGFNKLIALQGRQLEIFDNKTKNLSAVQKTKTHAFHVLFHADSNCFITACSKDVSVFSASNGFLVHTHPNIAPESEEITCMCLDISRRRIILGFTDGTMALHDLITGAFSESLEPHTSEVIAVKLHSEESFLENEENNKLQKFQEGMVLSASRNGEIKIQQLGKRKGRGKVYTHPLLRNVSSSEHLEQRFVRAASSPESMVSKLTLPSTLSPNFHPIPTSSRRLVQKLHETWKNKSQDENKGFCFTENTPTITMLSYSALLCCVATCSDGGTIFIWDAKNSQQLKLVATLEFHTHQITGLTFLEPHPALISSDMEGKIVISTLQPCPDPFTILVELSRSCQELFESKQSVAINSIFWFEEEQLLVSGNEKGIVTLWDLKQWLRFEPHFSQAASASIPPTRKAQKPNGLHLHPAFLTELDSFENSDSITVVNEWKAHDAGVCCMKVLKDPQLFIKPEYTKENLEDNASPFRNRNNYGDETFLITCSFDVSVKFWTLQGHHIGSLQQKIMPMSLGPDIFWGLQKVEYDAQTFTVEAIEEIKALLMNATNDTVTYHQYHQTSRTRTSPRSPKTTKLGNLSKSLPLPFT